MTDHQLGIHHFESVESLGDVAGREHFFPRYGNGDTLVLGLFDFLFEVDLLEVENDVRDIFLNAGNGIEFVFNAVDFDRGDRVALQRGEQYATEGVAHGDAIAGLQRLELEFAEEIVGFEHYDVFRFLEC